MSAFIVGDDHLNALLTYAVDRRISYWNPRSKERTDITSRNVEEVGRIGAMAVYGAEELLLMVAP